MTQRFFITGTDTGVGKTYISTGLLKAFSQLGYSTLGIKPIASGGVQNGKYLYNEDALALQQASSIKLDYQQINPFCFEPPIAPHIAAERVNTVLTSRHIMEKTYFALNYSADIIIVEGVGGWHVPLNETETMANFVISCNFSVIIVVGMRLGCLNHAILTYQAIKNTSLHCVGWIANYFEANEIAFENLSTLQTWLDIPLLGTVGFQEAAEKRLDVEYLL